MVCQAFRYSVQQIGGTGSPHEFDVMEIIDTHLHLIYPERFSYPWTDHVPALRRRFPIEEYSAQAAQLGIVGMLHMEVDVQESHIEPETAFAVSIGHGVLGAIAACRPEASDFAARLDAVAADPRIRGFRRVLHTGAHEIAQTPRFLANLKLLSKHGRPFDFCVWPHHIPIATAIAHACPDVQFVLDHCGMPDIRGRKLDPWRDHIRQFAALPNVACKISGVVAYGDTTNWSVNDLRPYVEHVIGVFGWGRVLWGSDWPVCTQTADLRRWVDATHTLLTGTSHDEQSRLLSRNARRIYLLETEQFGRPSFRTEG
jgi:predicted TIM-barrel fold metal-dependent hydrolase